MKQLFRNRTASSNQQPPTSTSTSPSTGTLTSTSRKSRRFSQILSPSRNRHVQDKGSIAEAEQDDTADTDYLPVLTDPLQYPDSSPDAQHALPSQTEQSPLQHPQEGQDGDAELHQAQPLSSEASTDSTHYAQDRRGRVAPQSSLLSSDSDAAFTDVADIKRRLMDVESSFIVENFHDPPRWGFPRSGHSYQPRYSDNHPSAMGNEVVAASTTSFEHDRDHPFRARNETVDSPQETPFKTPATTFRRASQFPIPPAAYDDGGFEYGESTVSSTQHDTSFSSPAAAVLQRHGTEHDLPVLSDEQDATKAEDSFGEHSEGRDNTPTKSRVLEDTTDSYETSSAPLLETEHDDSLAAEALYNGPQSPAHSSSHPPSKRPSYLQSHQASQRSSASSYHSHGGRSESTLEAHQMRRNRSNLSGTTSSVRPSNELSRLPSFGSIASSLSGDTETALSVTRRRALSAVQTPAHKQSLEQVDETSPLRNTDVMETPIPGRNQPSAPTNTVIASRVRDMGIPNNALPAPVPSATKQMSTTTPYFGRVKNNLTLKEQNGRIDKLSKENFDLKLKIHYLNQALESRSDEGVKELIHKSAQLQADLVKAKKESQSLRKRVKEFESGIKRPSERTASLASTHEESDGASSRGFEKQQLEDEVLYLREQMQRLEADNQRLSLAHAIDQRRGGRDSAASKTEEHWQDMFNDEVAARHRAETHVEQLQRELTHVRGSSSDITLVDQLRQENMDLRRDLGAQTSMLTSRIHERDRLQQEIEDLKMVYRHEETRSSGGESIFDRSVSRNQYRPTSRASQTYSFRPSPISDSEREHWESRTAKMRDEVSSLKIRNHELLRDLRQINDTAELLRTAEAERDEATNALKEADADVDFLTKTVQDLEDLLFQKEQDVARYESEIQRRDDESNNFQTEVDSIRQSLSRLVDSSETSQQQVEGLQQDLAIANGELEALEQNLRESSLAKERLEIQAESAKQEVAFLREEQENDKMKLANLQTALRNAKANVDDGNERMREMEEMHTEHSRLRDEIRGLRKIVTAKDVEMTVTQEKLHELEMGLTMTFSGFDGSGAYIIREIETMKRQLEDTLEELENARGHISEKEKRLRDREILLESSGLENRRLGDMLERERQARKHDQNEHDRARRRNATTKVETQVLDLENKLSADQIRIEGLRGQIRESNHIIFSLWERLSKLCGPEWVKKHGLDYADHLRSSDELLDSKQLAILENGLDLALQHMDQTAERFEATLREKEAEISHDFEKLDTTLTERMKRLEQVERAVGRYRYNVKSELASATKDLTRYKDENKLLRRELKYLKQGSFALPGLPSPSHDIFDRSTDLLRSANQSSHGPVPHSSRSKRYQSSNHSSSAPRSQPDTSAPNPNLDGDIPNPFDTGSPRAKHATLSSLSAAAKPTRSVSALGHVGSTARELPSQRLRQSASSQELAGHAGLGGNGAGAGAVEPNGTHSGSMTQREQTWLLRLEELNRRLKLEQEGRLLDRHGARERLLEGERERKKLREALQREKTRKKGGTFEERMMGVASGGAGDGDGDDGGVD